MCGIAGFVCFDHGLTYDDLYCHVSLMTNALKHRGPDGTGVWVDVRLQTALGHTRLAIHDLCTTGDQPMVSCNNRFVIVFNGEIYNFNEIRTELNFQGCEVSWRGTSDTEVLVEAISFWGLEKTIAKLHGMFAFALLDRIEGTITFVRDRFGEKPLYYAVSDRKLFFGSELKALVAHPDFTPKVDVESLGLYLKLSYVPSPKCIYKNVYKVDAGEIVQFNISDPDVRTNKTYWSPLDVIRSSSGLDISFNDAKSAVHDHLVRIVRDQMLADVKLGAFFSGGIDSSIVCSIMQSLSPRPIETFTIGYDNNDYDESKYAKDIAGHLGCNNTVLVASDQDAFNLLPDLASIYDEPFADASQIPTCILSKLTRRYVTVSLSGDGGDEVFAGYNRHVFAPDIWGKFRFVPKAVRGCAGHLIRSVKTEYWDRLFRVLSASGLECFNFRNPGFKLHKLAKLSAASNFASFYDLLISNNNYSKWLLSKAAIEKSRLPDVGDDVLNLQLADMTGYLKDDILVKVDRASMASSLESRTPFLDHKLVEFALSLPLGMRVNKNQGKFILREILKEYIPEHLFQRPKTGFNLPLFSWLRGALKEWAMDMVHSSRHSDVLDSDCINKYVVEFINGKNDDIASVWTLLMLYSWIDKNNVSL